MYSGKERLTKDGAIAERVLTKKAVRELLICFQISPKSKGKKLLCT